jgi:hypothetical protein
MANRVFTSPNPDAASYAMSETEWINPDYGCLSVRGWKGEGYRHHDGVFYDSLMWEGEVWAYKNRYYYLVEQFTRPCPIAFPIEKIDRKMTHGKLRSVVTTTMSGEPFYEWNGGEIGVLPHSLALNILIDVFNAPSLQAAKGRIDNYQDYQVSRSGGDEPNRLMVGAEAWLSMIGY